MGPRKTTQMIVYMFLNEVTDMVYVGKTEFTLKQRWDQHVDSAKSFSNSRFHVAIREYGDSVWTGVVLSNTQSAKELTRLEADWIDVCSSADPMIGYNSQSYRSSFYDYVCWLEKGHSKKHFNVMQPNKFYSECGKLGAKSRKKEDMSEEEIAKFREWGRKGAERSKAIALEKKLLQIPHSVILG